MSLILSASELLSVEPDMEIYDFSCGVGTLLAMSAKKECKIYGQEEDIDKAIIAFVLLSMAGVKNPIIEVGDVLQNPMTSHLNGKLFDRIIRKWGLDICSSHYREAKGRWKRDSDCPNFYSF